MHGGDVCWLICKGIGFVGVDGPGTSELFMLGDPEVCPETVHGPSTLDQILRSCHLCVRYHVSVPEAVYGPSTLEAKNLPSRCTAS